MDSDATSLGRSALVDETAAAIRARIMSGEIPIGAQLRQAELAAQLGISRTPIREALRQLQAGGLIEVLPRRGAVVRVPSPWEVREAYEVRAELEGLAAERAVRRVTRTLLDELRATNEVLRANDRPAEPPRPGEPMSPTTVANDRFHTLIHEIAGNDRLTRTIREINEAFPRNVSANVLQDDHRHQADNLHEHERIVAALESEDPKLARREMRDHVLAAGEQLARWYERRTATVFRG
ncbi:DNA-binding GntR family transcriptional regulator [Actinocorallia herbida]|uniref:DNA-binding GntR family transcriptional regulator n=1 Tax=Actinocorallia herbida TaxID=58109 RepID=A0A3N1D6H2_9ACTN|nr:GntR family transcriptional regulator [Actinocorallia herbida]ROO89114.1 DNA-binding GntR family transcriptional regulator [Actinocorallia herbida]